MKPITLTVHAFGPYAGQQVFDFRQLGDRSFFLIHGPTGAGKTTILDAMCYALYGDTSGAERKGEQMRSQQAALAVSTQVTFDFALGTELYRVTRSPEQERPKKKGGGTTTQPPSATLWQRTGLVDDAEEGTVLAGQPTKVTEYVERLLGFRSDQFRQVVMLPQGKFRELLTANSNQREAILEALFQTEMYRRIQEALKEKAKQTQQEVEAVQGRRRFILEEAQAPTPADLDARKKQSEAELASLRERLAGLRQAEKDATARWTQAFQSNEKLKEQNEARKALATLETRRAEIGQKQALLTGAKNAATLSVTESALNLRAADAKKRREEVGLAQQALTKATAEKEAAAQQLAQEEARQGERETRASELTRLNDLKGKVETLSQAKIALTQAQTKAGLLNGEHTKAKEVFDGLQPEIEKKRTALATLRETVAGFDGAKLAATQAEGHLKTRRGLETLQKILVQTEAKHKDLVQKVEQSRQAATRAKEAHAQLQQAWIDGQAAILAQHLKPGQPCPVCGGKEHPVPASSDQVLPDEATLKAKLDACQVAEHTVITAEKEERTLAQTLVELQTRKQSLREAIGPLADEPVGVLEKKAQETLAQRQATEQASRRVPATETALQDLQKKFGQAHTEIERLDQERQKAMAAANEAAGLVKGQEGSVPEALRDPMALAAAIQTATENLQTLQKALEQAQKQAGEADKALAACTKQEQTATAALKAATDMLVATQAEFLSQLTQQGFADPAAYQSAKRSPIQITALETEINQFHRSFQAAKEREDRATQAAAGLVLADLKALEEAQNAAKVHLEGGIQGEATLAKTLTQIEQWLAGLRQTDDELQKLEQAYALYGRLSEVANGKNVRGITLQRFVLAWLLDDVLDAASLRLRTMSRGRYQLQRMKERLDQRAASGLDVEVFDSYTGMSRAVATLSGGESFLASLALALGLADVVQAYAGGVRLQTMFVDEGFGSLDPEALDLAIRSLIDLQKGGRLVGIISHVPELRERIDARLEIMADRQGSTARFVVA